MNFMWRIRMSFVFFIAGFVPYLLPAQQNPYGVVTIASPTAGALAKYADIPVSYHTGIPQINIPLYTIKAGPLEMPIGLSYHASGLKVIEPASWVGIGWSLDAGGVITRTVVGQPDEKGTGTGSVSTNGYFSDFGYNKYLYSGNLQDWIGFAAGRKDGEPDLFFFNFGGYSGKFFFRDDRTPILVPQQDLKIIPYFPSSPNAISIQAFTVITPDGTQYFFGNTPGYSGTATETTASMSAEVGYASGIAISSWYLNKVTSADGKFSIDLYYTSEGYGYYTMGSTPMDSNPSSTQHEFTLVKNILAGVRLDHISFPNGKVTFNGGDIRTDLSDDARDIFDNYNAQARALGSIEISNTSTDAALFKKKFQFDYGYIVDNNTAQPAILNASGYILKTDRSRLRLDAIRESSSDNAVQIPPRKFTYFNDGVPRRVSLGIDHWGFYNGQVGNQTLIPTYNTVDGSTITTINGANRDASWPAMRGGTLQQITYPTGGTTSFDYEPADNYSLSSSEDKILSMPPNLYAHVYGQASYVDVETIVSDGNAATLTVNNNSDYNGAISIKNITTNQVIYSNASLGADPHGGTATIVISPISMPAGTYSVTLTASSQIDKDSDKGLWCSFSQLGTVITQTPITIGGLRIKTITHKETSTTLTPIVTSYSYPEGGYLYSFPTYIQHLKNDMIANLGYYSPSTGTFVKGLGSNNGCPLSGSYYLKSGGSLRPMATTQGYHIGYRRVQVSQTGNGYTMYTYNTSNAGYGTHSLNPTTQSIDISLQACDGPNYPPAPLPFDYSKGELYSEQHYDEAGNILKDAYYANDYDLTPQLPTPGFIVQSRNDGSSEKLFGTLYDLSSPRKVKTHITESIYTPGVGGGTMTHKYKYYWSAYHNQLTREVTSTSTGDSIATNTKYAQDFHSSSWDLNPSSEAAYTTACNSCQATYNTAVGTGSGSCTTDACRTTAFLAFRQCMSNARNAYVDNRAVSNTTYTTNHNTSKNAANAELKPILDLQDENKIVPIEESHYLNFSLTGANFTRFDYSTAPTGIPYPNKAQAINIAIPSLAFTGATISGNGLAKDSRYQDESTFGYLNGNPARVINHDGTSTMYIWDYQNTNPIAKTVFSSVDTTCFTSFEADGTGNWTVASTVRDNSTAITGTVCYNLTSGSITKPGLTSGKKYIVSYWSKSASSYTVTGATVTTKAGRNTGGWYYYEHAVTMTGTTLTITGSNKIDELRMYPQGAQMTSYTYQPLVGMTTMNDPNGEITYYEYDGLARLKNVKDYQANIIKNNQYNYVDPNACGGNCYVLTMQTLAGTNTIGYPVGVFNVNGGFVGNAANQAAYVTTWMSDATNAAAGTIVAGPDPLHFKFTVNPGKTIPNGLTGCRYYQFDVAWTNFDAFHNDNGVYIDFGDGTGMRLGVNESDSNVVRAPNTVINLQGGPGAYYIYWIHSYPNANSKTIRIYHNDANEQIGFDNAYAPATALTLMKNLTGNIPQHTPGFGGRCNQQASYLTTTGITNWSSINSVTNFELGTGDLMNACTHVSFPQDFMAGNKNLQVLFTSSRGYYLPGYIDTTFKISRLKSDWNTYFTNLTMLEIDDNHWNHEDLSALIHLTVVGIGSGSTLNSYSQTNNPLVPMTTTVIDNIINQVAAGAGHFVTNGFLNMPSGGGLRSAASNAGVTQLKSMNWTVVVNGVTQ